MALDGAWNAYIFREGKSPVRGSELLDGLTNGLLSYKDVASVDKRTALLDLLIRAGELEGALLDASCSQAAVIATIADAVALNLVSGESFSSEVLSAHARTIKAPEQFTVTPPEGFAYYSLHPLDFADLVKSVAIPCRCAAIIGIRSIGTTLSAVVKAALQVDGIRAQRTTVRPTGHPYDRRTEFSPEQMRWIWAMQSHRAEFFVVDEGPGMSGSSFLSVGDALLSAGVPRQRIAFLCSRDPYPPSLTAPNAAERWPAYRSYCTRSTRHLPKGAEAFVAGGIWRAHVYDDPQQWPASWLQMERLKFFSSAGDTVYKFEGHGRFGKSVHARSIRLAEAGFGPRPLQFEEGFSVYPRLCGKPLNKECASPAVLEHLARYCCFRAQNMSAESAANAELEKMLFFNVKQEFGIDLATGDSELRVVKPVIADGRMSPHKWFDTNGILLKVDSSIHGDDHFFPGPTDIAWDLAGVIVEWDLDDPKAVFFLDCYQRASGDNPQRRLPAYLLAYSIFRTAYCKMASASMEGSDEEPRLLRDYRYYRAQARRYVPTAAKPVTVAQFLVREKSPAARLA